MQMIDSSLRSTITTILLVGSLIVWVAFDSLGYFGLFWSSLGLVVALVCVCVLCCVVFNWSSVSMLSQRASATPSLDANPNESFSLRLLASQL